jgi:hypothetical protein
VRQSQIATRGLIFRCHMILTIARAAPLPFLAIRVMSQQTRWCVPRMVGRLPNNWCTWKCARCGKLSKGPLEHFPYLIIRACNGSPSMVERATAPPGDVLQSLIAFATNGGIAHGIDCEAFRQTMNRWGWRGCWANRREIMSRVRAQALREKYSPNVLPLTCHVVIGLLRWSRFTVYQAACSFCSGRRLHD